MGFSSCTDGCRANAEFLKFAEKLKEVKKRGMKAITIKLKVPESTDEKKFSARLKKIAEKMLYLEKLSAEEIQEIFGTFEEEIEPAAVREKEKKRIKWLYSTLR